MLPRPFDKARLLVINFAAVQISDRRSHCASKDFVQRFNAIFPRELKVRMANNVMPKRRLPLTALHRWDKTALLAERRRFRDHHGATFLLHFHGFQRGERRI